MRESNELKLSKLKERLSYITNPKKALFILKNSNHDTHFREIENIVKQIEKLETYEPSQNLTVEEYYQKFLR